MSQPRPWVEEVLDVLGELGGEGTLEDIYGLDPQPQRHGPYWFGGLSAGCARFNSIQA